MGNKNYFCSLNLISLAGTFLSFASSLLLVWWFPVYLLLMQVPGGGLLAQTPNGDSLRMLLTQPLPAEERCRVLDKLVTIVNQSDPEQSFRYATEAIALAEKTGKASLRAGAINSMAKAQYAKGNRISALEYAFLSRKIAADNHLIREEANALVTLGALYQFMQEFDSSLVMSYRCNALYRALKDSVSMGKVCNNIGVAYANAGQPDSALKYYAFSHQLLVRFTGQVQPQLQNNIGEILAEQRHYPEALAAFRQSLAGKKQQGNLIQQTKTLRNIGYCLEKSGQPDSAMHYYQQAYALGQQFGQLEDQSAVMAQMAGLHALRGNYREAYTAETIAMKLADSLRNRGQAEALARAEVKQHLAFKDRENSLLRNQLAQEVALQANQRNLLILSALLVALLLGLVYVFWRLSRERHQHLERITELNTTLEQRVEARTQTLVHRNQQLETYADLNSHTLRSKLATLMGLLGLMRLETLSGTGARYLALADKTAHELDQVVHQINDVVHSEEISADPHQG